MLGAALQAEVAQYLEEHRERDENGHALVVRNGNAKPRKVTTGAGTFEIEAPRVNDKRVNENGVRQKFTSKILPPYMRRSPKVAEVIPILYLRGLSTGDFREALPVLLGKDAAELSPTNIARLTTVWQSVAVDVEVEFDGAAHRGGVEVQQVSELEGSGNDEMRRDEGWRHVVLVIEGEIIDGRVLLAKSKLDVNEGRIEHREGRGLRVVPQDAGVGHVEGDHDWRFLVLDGAFFGGGCPTSWPRDGERH
jgi:hypothetical protein